MKLLRLTEKRRKEIVSLAKKKGRVNHGQMLVEGRHSVVSALAAGAPLVELLVTPRALEDESFTSAVPTGVSVYQISEKEGRQISTVETHQGVIAVAQIEETSVDAFLKMDAILVLDGVQDPGNVGTLLRTASWFGVQGIIASEETADFYNPKVVRASMGGIWDVSLVRVQSVVSALQDFQRAGLEVVCADLDGIPLKKWMPAPRTALVIGSEAHGVSEAARSIVDTALTINQVHQEESHGPPGVESLNAGIAAGIFMHYWRSTT